MENAIEKMSKNLSSINETFSRQLPATGKMYCLVLRLLVVDGDDDDDDFSHVLVCLSYCHKPPCPTFHDHPQKGIASSNDTTLT